MHFQNIHTFTYHKTLLDTIFLIVFKIVKSLHCILNNFIEGNVILILSVIYYNIYYHISILTLTRLKLILHSYRDQLLDFHFKCVVWFLNKRSISLTCVYPLTTNVTHHTETSQIICIANQLTGFYMMENIGC